MSSKKPAPLKRAAVPRASDLTREFRKDWERLNQSGRFDMGTLKRVMTLLIENDAALPSEYRDHSLIGEWADHRECHVRGDFLLIYRLPDRFSVIFVRAGTHSELFGR